MGRTLPLPRRRASGENMSAWTPQTVHRVFTGLVSEEIAGAYEHLLEANGVLEEDAASFFGDEGVATALTNLGMATVYAPVPGRPSIVDPVDPDLAIQGVLNSMQAQVFDLQQLLAEGTRRAMEAHGMHRAEGRERPDLAEILTDRDEIIRVSGSLINDARRDFLELDSLRRDIPISEEMLIETPGSLKGRITHRAIYDQAYIQDDIGRKSIQACLAAGQQVRWLPEIRTKLQVADTSTALVALTLTGMGGALLIRAQPLVSALREYAELLWETATPVNSPAQNDNSPLNPEQREVLGLLAAGLTRDSIAERIGKHKVTVGRHVTAIYHHLGVTTPFQAGAAAQRRGWLS